MNNHSGFASLHPAVLFAFYVGLFLFTMLFMHPGYLAVSFITVILLNVIHDRGIRLRKSLFFFLFIGLIVLIVNPLISQRGATILFYLFDRPITLESIVYGMTMMLSLITLLIGFISFNYVVTEDKFLYLFSSIAPKAALLTVLTIRFVPLLKRRLSEIIAIQWTRGVRIDQGSIKIRSINGMKMVNILLTWSLEEALQTADSMKSRGYGVGRRSSFFTYMMDRRDKVVLSIFIGLIFICLVGYLKGYGSLTIYPELARLTLSGHELFYVVVFSIFNFVPFFVEGRDWLLWRFSR